MLAPLPRPEGRRAAALIAALATARVLLHGALDQRPRFGGSESADLSSMVDFHAAIRGTSELNLIQALEFYNFKPPLYYAGIPLILSFMPQLRFGALLAFNALALALALAAAWRFGQEAAGGKAGLWAVLLVASVPGIVGRVTQLTVEPWHTALLGWSLLFLLRMAREPKRTRHTLGFAAALGAGLCIKWNFGAYLLLPVASLAIHQGRRGADRIAGLRGLLLGGLLGLLPLFAWLTRFGDLGAIFSQAGGEPSFPADAWAAYIQWPFRWILTQGLGPVALPALLLAILGPRIFRTPSRTETEPIGGALLAGAVASVLVLHILVPHKEGRYLLPALWAIAVWMGLRLTRVDRHSWLGLLAALGATGWVLVGTLWWGYNEVSARSLGLYPESELHFAPLRGDLGLSAALSHPSLATDPPARVALVLAGHRSGEYGSFLAWELHARPLLPATSLPDLRRIEGAQAREQLRAASHLLTNRELAPSELRLLEELGFVRLGRHPLDLGGSTFLELWGRTAASSRPANGP